MINVTIKTFSILSFPALFLSLTVCEWWISAGQIDAAEIQHSLRTIGVNVSLEDATRILQRSANSILISGITSHGLKH